MDKRDYTSIHCLVKQRRSDGSAPVVLESSEGDFYALPTGYDAVFELILRHLHGQKGPPWPDKVTPQNLLFNRAIEALKLPGRYIPTADGAEIARKDPTKTSTCAPVETE